MTQAQTILQRANPLIKLLIVLGTGLYLTELSLRTADYLHRDPRFVLAEGVIAICFTLEYLMRWLDDAQDHYGWHYPQSAIGLVDLISIAPFWLGLVAPPEWRWPKQD